MMGCDADARIIYGLPYEEAEISYDGDDIEVWLALHQGLPAPKGEWDDAHQAYYDQRKELPINTATSGDMMSGNTKPWLVIRASELSGWYSGTDIPLDHVKEPPPEWDELLRKFCEAAKIPFEQPKWRLISSYG